MWIGRRKEIRAEADVSSVSASWERIDKSNQASESNARKNSTFNCLQLFLLKTSKNVDIESD